MNSLKDFIQSHWTLKFTNPIYILRIDLYIGLNKVKLKLNLRSFKSTDFVIKFDVQNINLIIKVQLFLAN